MSNDLQRSKIYLVQLISLYKFPENLFAQTIKLFSIEFQNDCNLIYLMMCFVDISRQKCVLECCSMTDNHKIELLTVNHTSFTILKYFITLNQTNE